MIKTKLQILIFIALIAGFLITIYLANTKTSLNIFAGPLEEPSNLLVTNISSNSISIIYTTDDEFIGTIRYSDKIDSLDSLALDDRDQLNQKVNKYKVHSVTLRELMPETDYYFLITSGSKIYPENNYVYKVKTGSEINTNPPSQLPLVGKILNNESKEGLVILEINGSQKLSALYKENGNFVIPLNSIRSSDLNNYLSINDHSKITITALSNNKAVSKTISGSMINPAPDLYLDNRVLDLKANLEKVYFKKPNDNVVKNKNSETEVNSDSVNNNSSDIISFIQGLFNPLTK